MSYRELDIEPLFGFICFFFFGELGVCSSTKYIIFTFGLQEINLLYMISSSEEMSIRASNLRK